MLTFFGLECICFYHKCRNYKNLTLNKKYEDIKNYACDLERLWFGNDRGTSTKWEEA